MTNWAVVVAAGDGTRLGGGAPKPLIELAGKTLLDHCLDAIAAAGVFAGCVVASGSSWVKEAEQAVASRFGKRGRAVAGGQTRQASVRAALDRIAGDATAVAVHDAARPLAQPELFQRALAGVERAPGAICAIHVVDTIKRTTGDVVAETLDRSTLWRIQTPQAFRVPVLLEAHAAAAASRAGATDDAVLLERIGRTVIVVPGDERNIKITTTADLALAESLLGLKR